MRTILFILLLGLAGNSNAQFTVVMCELLNDVKVLRDNNNLDSLKIDERNENGSFKTLSIPHRFVESSFRKLTEDEYSIQFFAYGKPKQIQKASVQIMQELKACFPDYVMEVGAHNSDTFIKYFFCHPDEVGGNQIIPEYKNFAFKIIIQYREKEHSQITLTVS